jgi:hypothetical protein
VRPLTHSLTHSLTGYNRQFQVRRSAELSLRRSNSSPLPANQTQEGRRVTRHDPAELYQVTSQFLHFQPTSIYCFIYSCTFNAIYCSLTTSNIAFAKSRIRSVTRRSAKLIETCGALCRNSRDCTLKHTATPSLHILPI